MGHIVSDLTEGAAKGLFSGIGQLFKDVRTAITGVDPEKRAELEIKLAELESKAQEFEIQSQKITSEDRSSARSREVEIAKTGKKDWLPKVLAILAVLAFIGCLFALFTRTIPEGSARDVLMMLIGALSAIVKDLYGYFFGSSSGSSEKTIAMAEVMKSKR